MKGKEGGCVYGYMGLYCLGERYMGGLGCYECCMWKGKLGWEKKYKVKVGVDVWFMKGILVRVE